MVGPLTASQSTPTAAQKQKNDTNTAVPPSSDGVKPSSVDNAREIRRRKLVDAVNENCALEGLALFECQDSWSLWNRFTLCQAFQTQYMNCLNGQRTLLLQLGYGKEGNTEAQDELIKWHADDLYQHQVKERELEKKMKNSAKN